jgi:hypothetical protein
MYSVGLTRYNKQGLCIWVVARNAKLCIKAIVLKVKVIYDVAVDKHSIGEHVKH